MRNDTRKHFNNFAAQVAKLNGVPDATQKFAVDPTIQQRLEKRIQESSDFLSRINMVGVDELKLEAFLEVARAHPGRIEPGDHPMGFFDVGKFGAEPLGEIAVPFTRARRANGTDENRGTADSRLPRLRAMSWRSIDLFSTR